MTTEVKCAECDVDITGNSEHDHDLEVCCDCIEERYDSCQHCDQLFPKSDLTEVDDEPTCEDCFSEYYEHFYDCSEVITQDETYILRVVETDIAWIVITIDSLDVRVATMRWKTILII